jgi:hypothetical protein
VIRSSPLVLLLALASCGSTTAALAPAGREKAPASPIDLLPSDLDFVIRIDAARIREHPLMMALAKGKDLHLHDTMLTADISGMARLILPEIEQARSIVMGGRLGADGFKGDGIIAVEQGTADPPDRKFAGDTALVRLESRSRRFELYERASAARDEAALYVVMQGKGLVLATPAEMDAVLRVLRDGPDSTRLEPPPRGLLSFAGRFRQGTHAPLPAGASSLREIGVGLVRYSGSIEADDVLRVEAELVYESDKQAEAAAGLARKVLDRVALLGPEYGSLADSARLAPLGSVVGLRLSVPFALITRLH